MTTPAERQLSRQAARQIAEQAPLLTAERKSALYVLLQPMREELARIPKTTARSPLRAAA
ncbi:hypothetical protein [Geodermatophilus sp. CPCC 205506]|uniref:hypothetical protein n=1 Tax=Geodermatophilus sp. CPCC 205506 TaxID=2936596 RepID=UPI003EEC5CA4